MIQHRLLPAPALTRQKPGSASSQAGKVQRDTQRAGWDAFLVPYPTDVAAAPLRAGSLRQFLGDSCGPGVRRWFLKFLLRHLPSLSFLVCKMGPTISTVQCNKCELSNVQDFWSHPQPPPPNKSRCGRAQFTAARELRAYGVPDTVLVPGDIQGLRVW